MEYLLWNICLGTPALEYLPWNIHLGTPALEYLLLFDGIEMSLFRQRCTNMIWKSEKFLGGLIP